MPVQNLKAQMSHLPEQPGVYLFGNGAGETIYIGKARSLRDRVRSYLGARGLHPKTDALLDEADHLEVIVTDSVVEALALENHLVKERAPKYNIRLRDDKNYPYLQLTTTEAFPRVLVARGVERDGNFYAGPFMPASLARRTMGLTHRLFGIRSCNEVITGMRERPCLEYDINRCIAPCVAALCTAEQYGEAVQRTQLFFEGKDDELIGRLTDSMNAAAGAERFEEAAHLRDAARTVQTLKERQQKMATARLGDRDAFGLHMGPAGAVVHVFLMREGRVLERVELAANEGVSGSAAEILQASVEQFYEDRPPPAEVHLPAPPEDCEVLEAWLTDRAGRRVQVLVPKRGEKRGLIELANRNAKVAYQARLIDTGLSQYDALETLRSTLALPAIPRRIECFDISTIQGSETVASMVVCEDGRMRKSDYRKFRISPANHAGSDDFAAMHEVVQRRYRKLLEQGGPFPDLIVIDGGKGQLSAAYDALRELGLANLVAVGLAKKEELIYTRDREQPVAFAAEEPALRLLQMIRDEAHRFAVSFHRKARTMRDLRSELDSVPGIGPRRRRALLVAFGSLAGVRRASREELLAVVGAKTADAVLRYFAER
ncbi:MAG TPA: excinuclease ABC subunit UvrC [Vicinamibacterales bacterium]|nr:excinuclease ABC subunit UvrC [Vicinamibacterales bacterium]